MACTKLSPEALADIRAALIFTRDRFGIGKAQEYRDLIRDARGTLAQNPRLGTARPDIAPKPESFLSLNRAALPVTCSCTSCSTTARSSTSSRFCTTRWIWPRSCKAESRDNPSGDFSSHATSR